MMALVLLLLAATLEIGGDAAIRHGLIRSAWLSLALGAASVVAYGLVVNQNRVIDFGRLMGLYIAVFFVVSQLLAFLWFRETPPPSLLLGGALIVCGGLVIQFAGR